MSESINKIKVKDITYDVEDSVARAGLDKVLLFESITWAELKSLKDNGNLAPGTKYRITDYITTTSQVDTVSAGNQFDIIVEALTENTLNELASACLHEGDTYFSSNGCVLEAWQLWYDIENDTEKYEWADTENGKGVIYRMIDERGNDCPYDFKNIRFYYGPIRDYVYTFSYMIDGNDYDGTVNSRARKVCHSSIIRQYFNSDNQQSLNNIVFVNDIFTANCSSNSFGNNCRNNSFGNSCHSNNFGNNCDNNSFGNGCSSNSFGNYFRSNGFGNSCFSNKFGNSCDHNTFGKDCYCNTFGNSCYDNTFGNSCYYNNFGSSITFNNFGNGYICKVLNFNKTSITLNDEYYEDNTGKLVPIKHPDLSTQPSILPYKFMGQYVYEQLISVSYNNGHGDTISTSKLAVDNPIILECFYVGIGQTAPCEVKTNQDSGVNRIEINIQSDNLLDNGLYYKIVYTSMPEYSSYYY